MLSTFFRGVTVDRGRVLRAVMLYNASVLFLESGNDGPGASLLDNARVVLDDVSAASEIEGELYQSTFRVINALSEIVRG